MKKIGRIVLLTAALVLLAGILKTQSDNSDFKLVVKYSQTLNQMISAGNYTLKSTDVDSENFPLPVKLKGKTVELSARIFDGNDLSGNIIITMNEAGYRPATLPELLALGKSEQELQRNFIVVALGSAWQDEDGVSYVPYIYLNGHQRGVFLMDFKHDWSDNYRFLGVKK